MASRKAGSFLRHGDADRVRQGHRDRLVQLVGIGLHCLVHGVDVVDIGVGAAGKESPGCSRRCCRRAARSGAGLPSALHAGAMFCTSGTSTKPVFSAAASPHSEVLMPVMCLGLPLATRTPSNTFE